MIACFTHLIGKSRSLLTDFDGKAVEKQALFTVLKGMLHGTTPVRRNSAISNKLLKDSRTQESYF